MTTTGLANCPNGGDPADPRHFCASDAVEPSLSAEAEASAAEPNVGSTVDPNAYSNPDSWRVEVAARLERYRTRRKPRTPRYPSLLLPFDAPESWSRTASASGSAASRAKLHVPNISQRTSRGAMLRGTSPSIEASPIGPRPIPISGAGPGTIRQCNRVPAFRRHSGFSPERPCRSRL